MVTCAASRVPVPPVPAGPCGPLRPVPPDGGPFPSSSPSSGPVVRPAVVLSVPVRLVVFRCVLRPAAALGRVRHSAVLVAGGLPVGGGLLLGGLLLGGQAEGAVAFLQQVQHG
ncbi:MAG TPA: hypothetical protein VN969_05765 [Streptosporangiaceae bacterium]|nr:hypothetical protein [Streptosporangiaceae bacterium]